MMDFIDEITVRAAHVLGDLWLRMSVVWAYFLLVVGTLFYSVVAIIVGCGLWLFVDLVLVGLFKK
jgi:hypothetical protein